jgi:hypothetical protein
LTATLIAHFGYGGLAGAVYGALPPPRHAATAGLVIGVALWAGSYFGLLPALGLLRPASEHPARRNAMMLGAHLIWGTCLCLLHRMLLDDSRRSLPALRARGAAPQDTYAKDRYEF